MGRDKSGPYSLILPLSLVSLINQAVSMVGLSGDAGGGGVCGWLAADGVSVA
jgi:hypothetical protein